MATIPLKGLRNISPHPSQKESDARRDLREPFGVSAAEALAEELYANIAGEVRFDAGSRALYATDASNYRQTPIGVVIPKTVEDVVATVAVCRRHGAPILSRGGGTSLAGQCCNAAVIMDMSKYLNRILEVTPEKKSARVQPGVVLDNLRKEAQKIKLTFGPDPATHNHCTLGGMIGNNSCGVHSVMAGKTLDNVEELDILTYEGERMRVGATSESELNEIIRGGGAKGRIYKALKELREKYGEEIRTRMPKLPRRSSGFNLEQLLPEQGFNVARALTGTESSCVTILEATLRLVHHFEHSVLVVLGYADIYSAADHILEIMDFGPIGLEGIDDKLIGYERQNGIHAQDLPLLPKGAGWLLVEFGGDARKDAESKAKAMLKALKRKGDGPESHLYEDPEMEAHLWAIREAGLGATARIPGEKDTWEGWEDSSVPPENLGKYLRDLRDLLNKYRYGCALYGHFGQGCVHTRIDFDLVTRKGIDTFRGFLNDAAELCVKHGGSLSGEHGDGQSRAELLPKMYGEKLVRAFREFKAIWDPMGRMNPGKAIDAFSITENLRLGTRYAPAQPRTHFRFLQDDGSMARATERCVGIGECRRMEKGAMCPSYRVTLEEQHSTRGRAHLLFEMLRGDSLPEGFRSKAVKESLELCLACKACKSECPVNVDMATLKAEFLSGFYRGKVRPRQAYSMGLIYWACKAAAFAPDLANLLTQTPGIRHVTQWLAGIDGKRRMPAFAPTTFREWYAARLRAKARHEAAQASRNPLSLFRKGRVLLWPDTFNNHFNPEIAASAVAVLEDAGYAVEIPKASLCCGRPLYDFGMLDLAKHQLREILRHLRDEIRDGVPIIGLEPSCLSVFRDELPGLFGQDLDAVRLSRQVFTLDEFLMQEGNSYVSPRLSGEALFHGHCHQKSVLNGKSEEKVLKALGLRWQTPETGCCGMAGSFGFEKGKFEISRAIGERHLLPAVRGAAPEVLRIANGFSCREQMRTVSGMPQLHVAQVLHMGVMGEGREKGLEALATLRREIHHPWTARRMRLLFGLPAAAALLVGFFMWRKGKPKRAR